MARALILGYGNPLRSDDGLGWRAAVQLFRATASPDIEVLPCHQLTPELAESVSHAEVVLFLDSSHEGEPGEFHCEEVSAVQGSASFTHHLTPAVLLGIARDLYGAYPAAWLLTVSGHCFEPGEALSPEVEAQIPRLKARVREIIAQSLGSCATVR